MPPGLNTLMAETSNSLNNTYAEEEAATGRDRLPERLHAELYRSRWWCLLLAGILGTASSLTFVLAFLSFALFLSGTDYMHMTAISETVAALLMGSPTIPLFLYARRLTRSTRDGDLSGLQNGMAALQWVWIAFAIVATVFGIAMAAIAALWLGVSLAG